MHCLLMIYYNNKSIYGQIYIIFYFVTLLFLQTWDVTVCISGCGFAQIIIFCTRFFVAHLTLYVLEDHMHFLNLENFGK